MSNAAVEMANRVLSVPTIAEPWPHAILDDFLPADVFAELVDALPGLRWSAGDNRKASDLPAAVLDLLTAPILLDAFRNRFAFDVAPGRLQIEAAYFGSRGLPKHCDRRDKLLSAQVYLAGDPKGTELFDKDDKPAGVIEWQPNRLAAWTRPPRSEKHAAPKSSGRYVLLYWFLR